MSFDWQTEEDSEWENQSWQDKPETAASSTPPWRTILLILLLLSVAGLVMSQQVSKRLEAATTAVESDIFAAHNLLSRAAANQDPDLGKAVLSGRDKSWSRAQLDLLATGLFYEYAGLGLALSDADMAYAPLFREDDRFIDLVLSPGLNEAELSYVRDFWAFTKDGMQSVTLEQTAVYRRGETRWLLAPPEEPFWGEWQTVELGGSTFVYPQRDEEVVLQLSDDLSTVLEETCAVLPELGCSAETAVQIRFETNPESLLETADPATLYDNNLRLDLPTPTLVGLPIDTAGYDALLHAYGAKIVTALIGQSVAYDCCQHAPMFQAIVTYQLSELGLAAWPVTQETHKALADGGVHAEMLFPYWSSEEFSMIEAEDSWQLFGFVDFLLKRYAFQQTPLSILTQMSQSNAYQSWLVSLSNEEMRNPFGTASDTISRDWWFYAMMQAETTAVSEQPLPLPAQDLQIGCVDNHGFDSSGRAQTRLYRYVLDSESWLEEVAYPGFAFFNPLPQDDGVILQLMEASEEQLWQTLWWRNGSGVPVMDIEDTFSISLGQMDPDGRFLLTFAGDAIEIENEFTPSSRLIDIESCLEGECSSLTLEVTPYWSPDGQQMLLSGSSLFESTQYPVDGRIISLNPSGLDQAATVSLGNVPDNLAETVEVGKGISPFWLDNEHFGFIRSASADGFLNFQELVILSTGKLEPEVLIETADLQTLLPEMSGRSPLIMRYAVAHPTDANRILLMVSTATEAQDGYLFQIQRQSQEAELLFAVDFFRGEHSMGISPDGRFLVATGAWWQETESRRSTAPFSALHLYDFETSEEQIILSNNDSSFPAFTFDWSQDGNWLAFIRDSNAIGLIAPAYDYQQMITHEIGDCISLAWINSLP